MTTASTFDSPAGGDTPALGDLLRAWRGMKKRSQLDLALDAGVSQRHLSFIESGRAHPSREMILQLSEALDMPLRERNRLLLAAGYAPVYQRRSLETADMAAVRQALDMMLRHHDPFPAIVVDRQWNLLLANRAALRFVALLGDAERVWQTVAPSGRRNAMRMTLHPAGMQPRIRNWEQTVAFALSRLQREVAADPANGELRALFDDVSAFPGIPPRWRGKVWDPIPPPVLPLEIDVGNGVLKLFSMMSTFGTALDVTAEELRVEAFFPVDEPTAAFFRQQAAQ